MLSTLFSQESYGNAAVHEEGELYKVVSLHGHQFPLYYGYYDKCDRESPLAEPMLIYPDFLKKPMYTDEGLAFVTKMQDACSYYKGVGQKCTDLAECAECAYFEHGDELIGLCTCPHNKGAPGDLFD